MKGNIFANFIKGRDLFGHQPKLRFKGHEAQKSVIGGFISILVSFFTLIMII